MDEQFLEAHRRAVEKLKTGECLASPVPTAADVLAIMRTLVDRELNRSNVKDIANRLGIRLADT